MEKKTLWTHSTTLKYLSTSPQASLARFYLDIQHFLAKHELTECNFNSRKMHDRFVLVSLASSHKTAQTCPLLSSSRGFMVPSFSSQADRVSSLLNAGYEERGHQNDPLQINLNTISHKARDLAMQGLDQ